MIERVARSVVNVKGARAQPPSRDPTEGMSEKEKEKLLKRDPQFIERWRNREQKRRQQDQSEGSGFVIDGSKGHILTAAHLVAGLERLSVILPDGSTLNADLVGSDQATGIAVLRIANKTLPSLPFAARRPRAGESAINLAQMLPMHGPMASLGMVMGDVSGNGQFATGLPELGDFMLLDNMLPHGGFGGGPVVNSRGEVIGIITAIYGRRGYGQDAATIMNVAAGFRPALHELIARGKVVRGKIALGYDCEAKGCTILQVAADGPADKAGLKQGDVILGVNGMAMSDDRALRRVIALAPPGSSFVFRVERDGRTSDFTLASVPGDEDVPRPEPADVFLPPPPVRTN